MSLLHKSHYEVSDNGQIFSDRARPQDRIALFVNIDKQKKQKQKYTSLLTKHFQTAFSKQTQQLQHGDDALPWQCKTIAKRSHYKMNPFQSNITFSYLQLLDSKCTNNCFFIVIRNRNILSVSYEYGFFIYTGNIALGHRGHRCLDLKQCVSVQKQQKTAIIVLLQKVIKSGCSIVE